MIYKLLAAGLCLAGCLLPYLASPRQKLTRERLWRLPAWTGFACLQVMAWFTFQQTYDPVTALLVVLTLVMTLWVALTLACAVFNKQPVLLGCVGLCCLALVMGAG